MSDARSGEPVLAARRVLITGATSGLGLAMASALSAAGAAVAVAGRGEEHAKRVAATLPGAIGVHLDVRDVASVAAGVERAWAELGGIDLLVNNAGLGMRTVNPRFMTEPRGFWTVSPEASARSSTRTSPATSSSRGRSSRAC